jgi:hypothetical protein
MIMLCLINNPFFRLTRFLLWPSGVFIPCHLSDLQFSNNNTKHILLKEEIPPPTLSFLYPFFFFGPLPNVCASLFVCICIIQYTAETFQIKTGNNSPTFLPRLFSASTSGRRRLHLSGSY